MQRNNIIMHQNVYQYIDKAVIHSGIGRLSSQPQFTEKLLPAVIEELGAVTGQKPHTRLSKKSIAGFKVRQGAVVGARVTLRRGRMAAFLEKLVHIVLPRLRDFRGISYRAVDQNGNLTIGIKDHLIFPELSPDTSRVQFGIEITLVPKVADRAKALKLYAAMGIPFEKSTVKKQHTS